MKTPLWQIFITRKWEGELAHNCSWAFQNALVAILSKFFSVPLSSIENNDTFVKLDSTGSSAKHSNSVMEELKGDESCESRGLNVPSASSEKEDEDAEMCILCYGPRSDTTATKCGHLFCWSCIHTACKIKPECP
jgi:hypothetical protein